MKTEMVQQLIVLPLSQFISIKPVNENTYQLKAFAGYKITIFNFCWSGQTQMTTNQSTPNKSFISTFFKDCIVFLGLVTLIYVCYITSGVYHEKILKHHYLNPATGQKSLFDEAIIFTIFPQFIATIIGYLYKLIFDRKKNDSESESTQQKRGIPWTKAIVCSLVISFNMYTYNQAVVQASFPAVVMVKSCSLLSVILVGVFCSRVKDKKLKLGNNKIVIGILACVGIFVFNYFKSTEANNSDRPITLISSLLLVASLIGDGFLPDLQAEIKAEYKPSVMEMYLQINKFTFLISMTFSILTGKIFYFYEFFSTHEEIVTDIAILSILNALGQIIIYKMIKLYKQHIPAFIIGIRKCLTVVVNIIYFGHSVNTQQLFAIIFVFASIMLETYDNYLEKKQKEQENEVKTFIPINMKEQFQQTQLSFENQLSSRNQRE